MEFTLQNMHGTTRTSLHKHSHLLPKQRKHVRTTMGPKSRWKNTIIGQINEMEFASCASCLVQNKKDESCSRTLNNISSLCCEMPCSPATLSTAVVLSLSDRPLPVSAAAGAQRGASRLQPAPQIAGLLRVHSVSSASAQLHQLQGSDRLWARSCY